MGARRHFRRIPRFFSFYSFSPLLISIFAHLFVWLLQQFIVKNDDEEETLLWSQRENGIKTCAQAETWEELKTRANVFLPTFLTVQAVSNKTLQQCRHCFLFSHRCQQYQWAGWWFSKLPALEQANVRAVLCTRNGKNLTFFFVNCCCKGRSAELEMPKLKFFLFARIKWNESNVPLIRRPRIENRIF